MMSLSSDSGWSGNDASSQSFEYPLVRTSMTERFDGNLEIAELGGAMQEDWPKRVAQAHEEGRREGEMQARRSFEEGLRGTRDQVRKAVEEFSEARKDYFQRVEREVVELALTIARKVLHREAQLDKRLLEGIARVSMEHLEQGSEVSLRVANVEVEEWRSYFSAATLPCRLQIVGDASLPAGECVLSTQLGSTTLGLERQLQEIESGLFDLIAQTPRS